MSSPSGQRRHRGHPRPGRSAASAGQSTVELALLLPVLVLGVLAIVQVARVAADRVAVEHTAREAARQAALDPDPEVVAVRAAEASPTLDPSRLEIRLGPERRRGERLTIRVRYRSPTAVPVVGRLLGDVEVATSVVVQLE